MNSTTPAVAATMPPTQGRSRVSDTGKGGAVFFPNLDALRFFAFFLVFLRHGLGDTLKGVHLPGSALVLLKDALFNSGDLGVGFFFVLSGFLITYLILEEQRLRGRLDVKAFYIRRFLRIWPLYYATIAFGFLVFPHVAMHEATPTGESQPIWFYLFFLSNFADFFGYVAPLVLGITWSVAVEEQFYVIWPQLFARFSSRWHGYFFPVIILLCVAFRTVYRNNGLVLAVHSLSVMSDLAVGGWCAYLAIRFPGFKDFFKRLSRRSIIMCYLVGVVMIVFRDVMYVRWGDYYAMRLCASLVILRRLLLSLFFAFVILEQNYAIRSFVKVSSLVVCSRLGKYTYGLYLLHPIGLLFAGLMLGLPAEGRADLGSGMLRCSIGFVLSVLLALLSYHLFEQRFLRLKRRFAHVASGTPG